MNEPRDPIDEPDELDDGQTAALGALLGSRAVWAEDDQDTGDRIVALIAAEAGPVEGLAPPRPGRDDRRHLWVIGAVAVLFLVVGVAIALIVGDDDTIEVALAGTELAPNASAVAELDDTEQGLRIVLEVTGLSPAPPGTYYQAWVRNESDGVAAGTFHLRGGDGEIELWAGVSSFDYPVLTVTLQQEGAGPASSGEVVLRGRAG